MIKGIIFDWGRTLYDNEKEFLFSETKDVLDYLSKKYNLAIVSLATDGNFEKRWKIIKNYDLEKYFKSILFTQDNKDKLYIETLKKMNLNPKEIIIIDDRVIRGIAWGNKRGAKTIWIKKGKFSNELPTKVTGIPTYTITNLKDLLKLEFLQQSLS
ncbi:MAG: HAD hydrolase-like protein [Patescibacteria group bacterium]